MTDDLVKRLRAEAKAFTNHEKLLTPIQEEAADRIEQLEREKASWKGAYDGAVLALTERNKELEAALRNARARYVELDDKQAVEEMAKIISEALGDECN